jgi:hypothetical protein
MELLTIFGLAVLELWIAIPAGLYMKVNEPTILVLTMVGGITGIGIVIGAGKKIREHLLKAEKTTGGKKSWSMKVWEKYGLIGLGLLSPLLTGAPIGAALAVTLGSKPISVFLWFSLGVVLWSFIFMHFTKAGLGSLGI